MDFCREQYSGSNFTDWSTSVTNHGYIVDDIPHKAKLYTDLKFFEANFHGVMPLEILIDTKKKGGVLSPSRLAKINQLQDTLQEFNEFSKPLSIVGRNKISSSILLWRRTWRLHLPNELERAFIFSYLGNTKDTTHLLSALLTAHGKERASAWVWLTSAPHAWSSWWTNSHRKFILF